MSLQSKHEQPLRLLYYDRDKATEVLNQLLGKDAYELKVCKHAFESIWVMKPVVADRRYMPQTRGGRLVLVADRRLAEEERKEVESRGSGAEAESIPLLSGASKPIHATWGLGPQTQLFFRLDLFDHDALQSAREIGLYSAARGVGDASAVFEAKAFITPEEPNEFGHDHYHDAGIRTVAIKRLHATTPFKRVLAQCRALRRVNGLDHPNLVKALSAFQYDENGVRYSNIVFCLALGSLEGLFRGEYDHDRPLQLRAGTALWSQFAGLASALAYIHSSLNLAHRGIKPSNILIYDEGTGPSGLVLKIAGFGRSVDLADCLPESSPGPPPLTHARPALLTNRHRLGVSSAEFLDLCSVDVWYMGCVFTELVAYLVRGGSHGVSDFRQYVAAAKRILPSDFFNWILFDDVRTAEPEIAQWLADAARKDIRATQLKPVLQRMLSQQGSPLREDWLASVEACQLLLQTGFPEISYDDGVRLVRFTPGAAEKRPGIPGRMQFRLQAWACQPIDWSPFRGTSMACSETETIVTWKSGGEDLSAVLSQDEYRRYRPTCVPVLNRETAFLPVFEDPGRPAGSTQAPARTQGQPLNEHQGDGVSDESHERVSSGFEDFQPFPEPRPLMLSKDIYLCIDQVYTKPLKTLLCPILGTNSLEGDRGLFEQLNKVVHERMSRTLKQRFLRLVSWKRCAAVQFVKFHRVKKNGDQVSPAAIELPPPAENEYEHGFPSPLDVHMKLAGIQMVHGLKHPTRQEGDVIVQMLPKKRSIRPLDRNIGAVGWGVHVKMGFSVHIFMRWLLLCLVANTALAATWLVLIDSANLQDAFAPATIITTLITVGLALLQGSGK